MDAAWATIWEKDWELVAKTPPCQLVHGIIFAIYKHWIAASPFVDEVTGLEIKDPKWCRPGMPEFVACAHLVPAACTSDQVL